MTRLLGFETCQSSASPRGDPGRVRLPRRHPPARIPALYRSRGAEKMERSFIMIKPDGVQRGLVAEIIKRFEQKGFKLVAMKMQVTGEAQAKAHYADLASRPFFGALVDYICSGPVVAMVWEGKGVVKTGRVIIGATNPADSAPGSIRGDFCIEVGRNIIHGSDAVESANKEIALWFPEGICEWSRTVDCQIYEKL